MIIKTYLPRIKPVDNIRNLVRISGAAIPLTA